MCVCVCVCVRVHVFLGFIVFWAVFFAYVGLWGLGFRVVYDIFLICPVRR